MKPSRLSWTARAALLLLLVSLLTPLVSRAFAAARETPTASADLSWVERYRRALEVDPDNAALRYQLGLALLAAEDNQGAVREMLRAYPSLSQSVGINFNLGLAYTRLREPDSAQLYLEQAEASGAREQQELYPLASALYNVALVYLDNGDRDAALEVLRHVVELAPERKDLLRFYGEVLFQAGRTAEAQQELQRYLSAYPDDAQVRETLFALHYNRGLELLGKKRDEDASKAFARALAVAPESPMARYYLAFLAYRGERPEEVVRYLADAVAAFPEDVQRSSFPLLYNAARRLLVQGNYPAAAAALAPLVASGGVKVEYLNLAGEVALQQKEYAAAKDYYSRALQLDPAQAEALRNLAQAEKGLAGQQLARGRQLYRAGDLQGAYRLFQAARKLDPLAPELLAYLRETEKQLSAAAEGEFDQAEQTQLAGDKLLALQHVRQGLALWPEAARGKQLETDLLGGLELEIARQLLAAQSLLAMDDYPRASEAYAKLLEIDPHNEDAKAGYAQASEGIERQLEARLAAGSEALENGDLEGAAAAFAEVLQQRPENSVALDGMQRIDALRSAKIGDELEWARRAFDEGDYAAAREHFQNVLRQHDTPSLRDEYQAFESAVEKRLASLLDAARSARGEHDFRTALRLYRQARTVAADPESLSAELEATLREADETMLSLLVRAREALEAGEAGKSVELLRAVLRIEPSQAQALELLKQARSSAREEAEQLLATGQERQRQQQLKEARQAYAQALQIDPYLQSARSALDALDLQARQLSKEQVERLYLQGVAYYTQGKYQQAMDNWHQVLAIDAGYDKARRNIEKAERKLSRLKEHAQ